MFRSRPQQALQFRYQLKIARSTHAWFIPALVVLAAVVAASLMLQSDPPEKAFQIAELGTPLAGVLLLCWSVARDFRQGVHRVIAAQPVSAQRNWLRLRCVSALAPAFLAVFVGSAVVGLYFLIVAGTPSPLIPALLAALPSACYLILLAAAATLVFRGPWMGLILTLVLWSVDVTIGFLANPLLSLQGVAAHGDSVPVAEWWLIGKGVLILGALLLWLLASRQTVVMVRPPSTRTRVLGAALVVTAPILYVLTGAVVVVSYAWSNRAGLHGTAAHWVYQRFHPWGALDPTPLFGADLRDYVAESMRDRSNAPTPAELARYQPLSTTQSTRQYVQQLDRASGLEAVIRRYPQSPWADAMIWDLAQVRDSVDTYGAAEDYWQLARRFPGSPFTAKALQALLRTDSGKQYFMEQGRDGYFSAFFQTIATPIGPRIWAARQVIEHYQDSALVPSAAELISQYYPVFIRPKEMVRGARAAAAMAPPRSRAQWLLQAAQIQATTGELDSARALAREVESLPSTPSSQPGRLPGGAPPADTRTEARLLLARIEKSP